MSLRRSHIRVGTWNMEGKCTRAHQELLDEANADVWLLTEVSDAFKPENVDVVRSRSMLPGKAFAAVAGPLLDDCPSPHPATAMARFADILFVSTVLPWRGAKGDAWIMGDHGEQTTAAVSSLIPNLTARSMVWGGDWNVAFYGVERAGSVVGRLAVIDAVTKLGLRIVTGELAHRNGEGSIDHIAVPSDWMLESATRISADGLSDHDAYVVEVRRE